MSEMLVGMLLCLGAWAALWALFVGCGALVLRALGRRLATLESAFAAFWLGWGLVLGLLQGWHFVSPVGHAAFLSFASLGALGLILERRSLHEGMRWARARFQSRRRETRWLAALALLALLLLSNRAMGPITPKGDAGAYHIGAIRWIQGYPLVPGLANLQGRFGFNSSAFLYLAMLDFGPGPLSFYRLGLPLLFLVFMAEASLCVYRLARDREEASAHTLLGSLWIAGIVPYLFMDFASTSTDLVNLLLSLRLGAQFFRVVFGGLSTRALGFEVASLVALTAVGTSVKLSFVFYGSFASLAGCYLFLRRVRAEGKGRLAAYLPQALLASCVVVAVLGPWVIRGLVLTGYVAYPSNTLLSLDRDWRVPEAQVLAEKANIEDWARYPVSAPESERRYMLQGFRWFPSWLHMTLLRAEVFTLPLALFGFAALVYLRRALRRSPSLEGAPRQNHRATCLFLLPAALAAVLWFVTAPAERFAGGIFWLLGAGTSAALFQGTPSSEQRRRIASSALGFVALSLGAALLVSTLFSNQRYGWSLFVPPGPERGAHPIPRASGHEYVTPSGLTLFVPDAVSLQTGELVPMVACWDCALPCVRSPNPRLELRQPGSLRSGFRTRAKPGAR